MNNLTLAPDMFNPNLIQVHKGTELIGTIEKTRHGFKALAMYGDGLALLNSVEQCKNYLIRTYDTYTRARPIEKLESQLQLF